MNLQQRILKIMTDVTGVKKDGANTHSKYKYRSAEGAIKALRSALISNGVFYSYSVLEAMDDKTPSGKMVLTKLKIEHTFVNVDDPHDKLTIENYGYGSDMTDKSVYKAMTGAQKYALFNVFQIATDDDPEVPNDEERKTSVQKPSTSKVNKFKTETKMKQGDFEKLRTAVKACMDLNELTRLSIAAKGRIWDNDEKQWIKELFELRNNEIKEGV